MRKILSILMPFLVLTLPALAGNRTIARVEAVRVDVPCGTVPALPYQVFVHYSDGSSAWRQAVWPISDREVEAFLADAALHPAGTRYSVQGYVIGDAATPQGYPIRAQVRVRRRAADRPAAPVARPLPLGDVRLTGENRLTSNRELDIRQLLGLDVRQQLYNYRDTYGLSTEGYPVSTGWDSPTTKLKGHGSGHYMSAMAFAYACCDDPARRDSLKANLRVMVDELRACQERTFVWSDSLGRYWEARDLAPEAELSGLGGSWADFDTYKKDWTRYGYGYLNAIPAQHPVLVEAYRPYNNDQWVWAPYYTIHKQLAGLIDIATNVDDAAIAGKALLIARDMGLWVWNRLHYRTFVDAEGTQETRRSRPGNRYEMWNMYIAGEVGGMAESLSRLAELADDPLDAARLIEAAGYFESPAFFGPLARNIDDIRGRHANQHIPMITGALRAYRTLGEGRLYDIARNFWNLVQGRYVYATGGVGNGEMFREPYTQIRSMNTNVSRGWGGQTVPDPNINETCCAYNLAKLTKDLNCFDPDDARYMDYYERVLYNQIVGSLHPEHYGVTYQYAVGLDARKPFDNRTPQSSCCGGTGAENHVKYQEAAYFVSDDCLWVGLYLPSEARWREKDVTLTQDCAWPAEHSRIRVSGGTFAMKLRVPYWAGDGFDIRLNGRSVARRYRPCSYVEIPRRTWSADDVIEIDMPFGVHVCYGADRMDIAAVPGDPAAAFAPAWAGALMLGPLVMATREIHDWNEAEFPLDSVREGIAPEGRGAEGLYVLRFGGHLFQPDYSQTESSTRYLRLIP